ncbi:MAG: arginine deiminase-related protein [Fusobacterium sp.]
MTRQLTNRVFMVRPIGFNYNKETAKDNIYQNTGELNEEEIQEKALEEFDLFVDKLKKYGIQVNIIQDTLLEKTPDSIFPNNWFSSHENALVLHPMYTKNRREEVKKFKEYLFNIIGKDKVKVIDYSYKVKKNIFLEGTGSVVLDRKSKKAYCCISKRSNKKLFLKFCKNLGYKPIPFGAKQDGVSIYHTNVLMGIGDKIAIICLEAIGSLREREMVKNELIGSGKKVVEISLNQVKNYLGNILELKGKTEKFMVMSQTAYNILTKKQKQEILKHTKIITSDVKTIEYYGGGSVRCMIGEIF